MRDDKALEIYNRVTSLLDNLSQALTTLGELVSTDVSGALMGLGAIDDATNEMRAAIVDKNSRIDTLETELEHMEELA